jgi:hypothetical protein
VPNVFIPLSFTAMAKLQAQTPSALPFASIQLLPSQVALPSTNDGAFKVPGLRNIELTAPYFHDGSVMTLEDMVDFYVRGGNFPAVSAHLDANIAEIKNMQDGFNNDGTLKISDRKLDMVAFMKTLTDERVRAHSAPFDHPELIVPNGDPDVIKIPARDANGNIAAAFLSIGTVASPTNNRTQTISGTKEAGSTVQVSVNNGTAVAATLPTDTTWSAVLTGLVEGVNNIVVSSVDLSGIPVTVSTSVTLDSINPVLTINPITAPNRGDDFLLSGTVEAGINPVISVSTGASVSSLTKDGTAWSAQLSLLEVGANNITVTATDNTGNVTTATATVFMLSDGIFNGTRTPDISDAIKALRIAVGLITPTADDLLHGDVAPLGVPDGKIDLADVILIMRNVVGSINLAN